jgi:ribosomal protein S18 acetylase RimI-like enzyme
MPTNVIQVRAATRRDAPSLAALYAEAWRGAYRGIIPHLPLERMIARRGQAWWERALNERYPLLLLDFGGEPAGYATFGRSRLRHTPAQGEIFELYLHPVYQGLGLGRRLFGETRKRLLDRRYKDLVVWALADNDSACSFYLGLGGKPIAEGAERFDQVALRKVAFAWW